MDRERIIGDLKLYHDLGADVRYTNSHVPIRQLVTPDDPEIRELANILYEDPDFVGACQQFVNSFTQYAHEEGDFWSTASETLHRRSGDCDCLSLLLCSLLRVYIPANQVFCAVGMWKVKGHAEGHMYVIVNEDGEDRIVESTSAPQDALVGNYDLYMIFNDQYTLCTDRGMKVFDLKALKEEVMT